MSKLNLLIALAAAIASCQLQVAGAAQAAAAVTAGCPVRDDTAIV